jgi:SAM-dependent methyltransferase
MSASEGSPTAVPGRPIDGHQKVKKAFSCRDFGVSGETFELWEAPGGYRFTYPVPENIGRYYESHSYLSHHSDEAGLMPALYRLARSGNIMWKKRLLHHYLQKSGYSEGKHRLLDFGCGTGQFAQSCARDGWDTSGVETDTDASMRAKEPGGLKIYPDFESIPAGEAETGFDAITAWHVLEHVPQPEATLKAFHAHLKPGGIAVIAVPNFHSFDAQFYGEMWAGYDVPRHLHHFTPGFLNELAAGQGFRSIGLHRMLLDAFFVSLLSEQYAGSGVFGSLRAITTGLLSNISALRDVRRSSAFAAVFQKV